MEKLFDLPYKGGTNGNNRTPMVTIGYSIKRNNPKVQRIEPKRT